MLNYIKGFSLKEKLHQ